MYLSAERAGAVRCAERSLLYLSVCSVYLSFLSAFPSKHSRRYCCCAFPICPVLWRLASLLDPLYSFSSLLFLKLFASHSSKQTFEKCDFFCSYANEIAPHYYWIILGGFSVSIHFSHSSSISTPSSFCVLPFMWICCCCCCGQAWVCQWRTKQECMCEWLRPTRLFAMNCLKGRCPLSAAEYVRIVAEFVECICVCTVCFKLALDKLWVRCWRQEKRHAELVCRELETFIKTDHSRYYCLISPSLTPLASSSLVSGSVNRNWQANTWERSIAFASLWCMCRLTFMVIFAETVPRVQLLALRTQFSVFFWI